MGLARDPLLPRRLRRDDPVLQHRPLLGLGGQRRARCGLLVVRRVAGVRPPLLGADPQHRGGGRASAGGAGGGRARAGGGGAPPHGRRVTRDPVAAAAARSGEVPSEQLVTEALDRIEQRDGDVNAFTVVLRDEALAAARAVAAGDTTSLPLAGVPVSVKDHIWLAGHPATNGSAALRDFVPAEDAVPVQRLRAAGAVVVGKTTTRSSATAASPTTRCG